jgi:hypothetical protein
MHQDTFPDCQCSICLFNRKVEGPVVQAHCDICDSPLDEEYGWHYGYYFCRGPVCIEKAREQGYTG